MLHATGSVLYHLIPPQVDLAKPIGVKFGRGNDGGAYVTAVDAKLGNIDPQIKVRVCDCV